MSTINESTMQRLAFIKYLYTKTVSESHQAEPLSASSILTFHDSIELFLQLASEFAPINNPGNKKNNKPDFMDYWDLVSVKTANGRLSQEESMRQLNKARVALKHHGVVPSKLHTESFRATATAFFSENAKVVFGIEFADISMLNLVLDEDVRNTLVEAENNIKSSRKGKAIAKVAIAFIQLLENFENSKTRYQRSPFSIINEDNYRRFSSDREFLDFGEKEMAARMVDSTVEMLHKEMLKLERKIKILGFGIDFKRYTKFSLLTPHVTKPKDGPYYAESYAGSKAAGELSDEELRFCFDFVIESALQLQESDFEVEEEKPIFEVFKKNDHDDIWNQFEP